MAFDERKDSRKRKRGAASASGAGPSSRRPRTADVATPSVDELTQRARDVGAKLDADVDALARTGNVWPPRPVSATAREALERVKALPVDTKTPSLRHYLEPFSERSAEDLELDKVAIERLFADRVGKDVGVDTVAVCSSYQVALNGGRYTHTLVERGPSVHIAGRNVVPAQRVARHPFEETAKIVQREARAVEDDAKVYALGILTDHVSIADAPTLVALDTENTPTDKVRNEFKNAVKIPMTGAKDDVFVFESHLLHSVLEPWWEPPKKRVSSRTRSGGNERSTLDRWLEHIEKKFVARTKRDGKPSLTHTGDRTIILVTMCSRTVNADTRLLKQIVARAEKPTAFKYAPKR